MSEHITIAEAVSKARRIRLSKWLPDGVDAVLIDLPDFAGPVVRLEVSEGGAIRHIHKSTPTLVVRDLGGS